MGISSPLPASAIVVGNGVIGLSSAIALQQSGIATTLLGLASRAGAASLGNAGHIAIEQVEPLASRATIRSLPRRLFAHGGPVSLPWPDIGAWLPFSLRLLRASAPSRFTRGTAVLQAMQAAAFPAWDRLSLAAGARALLRRDGHYIAWETAESAREGVARWSSAEIGTASVRHADVSELSRLRGSLQAPVADAIRFEGSGQIADLDAMMDMLARYFRHLGGTICDGTAAALSPAGDGAEVDLAEGGTLRGSVALIAAGAASAALLRPLGLKAPLIAERGYHIQSATTDWPDTMPPVVFEDRSMIVTRFATGLRAAGFVEFARRQSPPDPRKWQRLRDHVAQLGISFTGPVTQWMGARPTLPDYLPAIGRHPDHPAIAYAFGHQHLGLTLAATTGDAVRAMLCDEPPPFDIAPLSLARFG